MYQDRVGHKPLFSIFVCVKHLVLYLPYKNNSKRKLIFSLLYTDIPKTLLKALGFILNVVVSIGRVQDREEGVCLCVRVYTHAAFISYF